MKQLQFNHFDELNELHDKNTLQLDYTWGFQPFINGNNVQFHPFPFQIYVFVQVVARFIQCTSIHISDQCYGFLQFAHLLAGPTLVFAVILISICHFKSIFDNFQWQYIFHFIQIIPNHQNMNQLLYTRKKVETSASSF